VLLDLTWRMHPDVTSFVSRSFYEGRLGSEARCATQAVVVDGIDTTGLRASFVEHLGDRVRSDAEAERVREVIAVSYTHLDVYKRQSESRSSL